MSDWKDLIKDVSLAVVAVCGLVTALMTRCDQAKHTQQIQHIETQVQTNAVAIKATSEFLDVQFTSNYVSEVKDAVNAANQTEGSK